MYALARNLRPAPTCSWTLSFLFSAYLLSPWSHATHQLTLGPRLSTVSQCLHLSLLCTHAGRQRADSIVIHLHGIAHPHRHLHVHICFWVLASALVQSALRYSYLRLVLMLFAFGSCFGFSAQLHCVLLYAFVFCSWRLHGVIMLYRALGSPCERRPEGPGYL